MAVVAPEDELVEMLELLLDEEMANAAADLLRQDDDEPDDGPEQEGDSGEEDEVDDLAGDLLETAEEVSDEEIVPEDPCY